jgi:hypothetical protein
MGTQKLERSFHSFRVAIVWRSAIRQETGAHSSAIAMVKNETERFVRNFQSCKAN